MKNEIRKQYRDNGLCDELVERIEIIDFTDYKMLMVKHPLMNECLMDVNVEPFWKNKLFNKELQKVDNYCDFLNKSLNVRTRGIRECIDKKDWGGITYLIHDSNLWNWFIHNHFDLDDDGYFYLIKMMWVLDEQTNNQLNWLDVDELIDLFTYRGNPQKIMNDEDLKSLGVSGATVANIIQINQNQDLHDFKEIIKKLIENNIKIIIFTTPQHKYFYDLVDNSEKIAFKNILLEIHKDSNLEIHSFIEKYSDLEIWRNPTHIVVSESSSIFSNDIAKLILEELK